MSAKYSRWQTASILEALKVRRVVMLAGARQCGKTTLVKQLDHTAIYRTLDNQVLLDAAKTDPMGFIQHGNELMIVDEIQRAPILLPAIKMNVDENTAYGRFLITGSAKIQSLPTVNESLAGRIRKIRLRTLTQGEINNAAPRFLQQAFTEEFNNNYTTVSKDDCINYALVGGYPEAVFLNNLADAKQWYLDYVQSLLERDLKDIINIRRTDSIKKLLYVLAAWSSKYMDFAAIGSGLALSRPTIQSYINALEGLYLVEKI
ncbi:MAG TPA: AAA family ATPase, partial [Gammaproteobacteria bacterium]|nr:AAA family ATPase [Gammaproteobacteria bacterium]